MKMHLVGKISSVLNENTIVSLLKCKVKSRTPSKYLCTSLVKCSSSKISCNYDDVYNQSINQPEEFWQEVSKGIEWFTPFTKVVDKSKLPFSYWFLNGKLNTCYNAVDRHVNAGKGDQTAIIHDSPITNSIKNISYRELKDKVANVAGVLTSLGVKKGDTVIIYMPMIPEAIISMLAASRIGAIHSLVFGGFAARELATRISHVEAKVVLTASCGLEPNRIVHYKPILDEALNISNHQPKNCIVFQRKGFDQASLQAGRDLDWEEVLSKAKPHDAVPVDSNDPAYVLYTSGTTGTPKGIVRPTGGHAVILPWTMKTIYGMNPEDVWWAASDLGWVVGHSYICYAPLLNGNTTIIYEGKPTGTPDAGQFFRVIAKHLVKGMFTAPTALRAIAKEDAKGEWGNKYDISSLKNLFVAGEPLDHETRMWAEKAFKTSVLDNWWQTETGYAIAAHCVGLSMSRNPPRGTTGKPFMGYDLQIINSEGKKASAGELGRIVCKLPLPPGNMSTLYKADDRFVETYFKEFGGFYDTMDAGIIDDQGYVSVQSREDDVINVAGHRLSTLALEEAMMEHPLVVEAAVIGVPDSLKGEVPLGLFVTKDSSKNQEDIKKEIVSTVRRLVGPVAAFRLCAQVNALPKTRSGKTPRKTFADLARDKAIVIPPTIEDPTVYSKVLQALRSLGYANKAPDPLTRK